MASINITFGLYCVVTVNVRFWSLLQLSGRGVKTLRNKSTAFSSQHFNAAQWFHLYGSGRSTKKMQCHVPEEMIPAPLNR